MVGVLVDGRRDFGRRQNAAVGDWKTVNVLYFVTKRNSNRIKDGKTGQVNTKSLQVIK